MDVHPALFRLFEASKVEKGVAKPEDLKDTLREVGLGRDSKGYFVYTHRARSESYKDPHDIPKKDIEFIASTG